MNTSNNSRAFLLLIAALLIYFLPFFIFGKYTIFPVVDNLDCYYVWNKIAAQPKYIFSCPSAIIEEYMNGLPKFTLLNSYSLFFLLNIFFSSFYAVALHIFLIHAVACFSMYILADTYLSPQNKSASVIASFLFGFQNFIYAYSLSISLLPLLFVVFIRMNENKQTNKDWILIALYPFLSNFQSVGLFVVFIWLLASISLYLKEKKNIRNVLIAVCSMCILYYLNNFPTINNLLFNSYFTSHRSDFKYVETPIAFSDKIDLSITGLLKLIFKLKLFILGGFVLFKMYKSRHPQLLLLFIFILCTVFFEFENILLNNGIVESLKTNFRILKMFHFNKFFVFKTIFQTITYTISFSFLFTIYSKKWLQYSVIIATFVLVVTQSLQWKSLSGSSWKKTGRSFEGYYSPELFNKIKTRIGLPENTYKVASFGIQPAASQYNGMYTIDGYINNYPIEYKNKFREVIKNDLNIIHGNIGYKDWDFETTGHRCYLQTEDLIKTVGLSMPIDKINPMKSPQTVHWNFKALRELGCNFIISSTEIQTSSQNDIILVDRFENEYYILFLYKLL